MKIRTVRHVCIGLAAAMLAPVVTGQSNAMSLDDYQKLMQSNAASIDAADAAVNASNFNEAREHVAVLRKNFIALRGFWSSRKRADAVRIVSDGMGRFAMIEELLGRPPDKGGVPADRVLAATKEFREGVCASCHDTYREGNRESGFHFKDGIF